MGRLFNFATGCEFISLPESALWCSWSDPHQRPARIGTRDFFSEGIRGQSFGISVSWQTGSPRANRQEVLSINARGLCRKHGHRRPADHRTATFLFWFLLRSGRLGDLWCGMPSMEGADDFYRGSGWTWQAPWLPVWPRHDLSGRFPALVERWAASPTLSHRCASAGTWVCDSISVLVLSSFIVCGKKRDPLTVNQLHDCDDGPSIGRDD